MFKRIYKYMINLSIRRKFFLGFLLAAILPMLLITFYSYSTTKSNLIEQNYINMENNLTQTNNNIEKKLENYSKSTALIYLNNSLRNYLTLDYSIYGNYNMVDAYYFINNYFSNILILNPDINLTTVYVDNKTLPSDEYFIKHITDSTKDEKWYNKLQNSTGNVIYDRSFKDNSGKYVFTLARYLNNGSLNYPYGILVMTIGESQLYSLIEKSSENNFSYIVDEDGIIVSCRDKNLITQSIYDVLSVDKSDFNSTDRMDIEYNGQKMLMAYKTMSNGWKTINMVSYNSFLNKAKRTASFVFVIFLLSLFLMMLLIYLLSAIFTKRINVMVKQVNKVQQGDFDIVLRNMGSDEIGKLSDAFNNMSKKLKFLIEEVYQKELLKKQAEMNVLQEQINPHFLYNALASISSLALRNNDKKVTEMVSLLSKFYRMTLNKGKQILTVRDELDLTKYYIEIQQRRFQNLLKVSFSIDETLLEYKTLKLLLQPFIENSINHGIWDDEKGINIIIRLYKELDNLIFEVVDDGIGMPESKLSELISDINNVTSGYGIKNVNSRIKLYYGEDFGVQLFSKVGIGTQVKIIIPIQK